MKLGENLTHRIPGTDVGGSLTGRSSDSHCLHVRNQDRGRLGDSVLWRPRLRAGVQRSLSLSESFTPCRHLRPSSGREHTVIPGTVSDGGRGTVSDGGQGTVSDGGRGTVSDGGRGTEAEGGRGTVSDRGQWTEADRGRGTEADIGRGTVSDRGRWTEADRGQGTEADRGRGTEADRG